MKTRLIKVRRHYDVPSIAISIYRYYTVTSDVLTSVKKMEDSLKRLKKVRGTEKTSQGISDDDKIRTQLILDIASYGDQVCLRSQQTRLMSIYESNLCSGSDSTNTTQHIPLNKGR